MTKYLDLFQVNAPVVSMTSVGAWESVIPEVSNWPGWLDEEHTLLTDGRIVVRELVNSTDGYRGAWMHTVSFDNQPVLIVQRAGRDGRDHFQRWVVDSGVYMQLIGYVNSQLLDIDDVTDVVNLLDEVYPEAVWHFYGAFHGNAYGVETTPKTVHGELMANVMGDYFPNSTSEDWLVLLKSEHDIPPPLIRRGDCALEFCNLLPSDARALELGYDRIAHYRIIDVVDLSIPCI